MKTPPQTYLVINTGGTKSSAALFESEEAGSSLRSTAHGYFPQANLHAVEGRVEALLHALCTKFNIVNPARIRVLAGFAGLSNEAMKVQLKESFRTLGFEVDSIQLQNDAEFSLNLVGANGAILIAGTGSICFGRDGVQKYRTGGRGWLLGDQGSAFWIGTAGLRRAIEGIDRLGPETSLHQAALQHFKIGSMDEIYPLIYQGQLPKEKLGWFAHEVMIEASKGDLVASEIITAAVEQLAKLATTLISQLNPAEQTRTLGLCGGLFEAPEAEQLITAPLKTAILRQVSGWEPVLFNDAHSPEFLKKALQGYRLTCSF